MALSVATFLVLSIVLFALTCFSYPEVGELTSLALRRPEEAHPLDLYRPRALLNLWPFRRRSGKLTVNETSVDGTGRQWVRVSWSDVANPKEEDVIALFTAKNWRNRAPLKSLYAVEDASYLTTGAGTFEVRLLNHRTDVRFALIRDFTENPRVLALSEVIRVRNKDYPLYVHLALTKVENEILVQWVSAKNRTPVVKWGTKSEMYKWETFGESITYTKDDLCGPPATTIGYIFPGYMHSVVLKDLVPGKKYFYIFGNPEGGFSEEHSFIAPPKVGTDETIKVIGLADMGQYNVDYFDNPHGNEPSLATSTNINQEKGVDLVVHVGDISYANGYAVDWDVFFDQLLPLTSKVPYMVAQGNHERLHPSSGDRYGSRRDSGGECGVPYERRLQMPVNGTDQPWYSFDFGPIHFLIFSAEHAFESGTVQYQFIESDLESVKRTRTPWVVVAFHRPMFPGITEDSPPAGYWYVAGELRATFDDLFFKHKVDFLWSGHHHSYQRTCPVHKLKCVEFNATTGEARAPVQLIFGNSGARLYNNLVKEEFIEFQALQFGYMRFTVNRTHFISEAVENANKTVMDSLVLTKAHVDT